MKRLVAMLLCCVMAFSFTACGDSKGNTDSQQNSQNGNGDSQQNSQDQNEDSQQDSQGGGEDQTSGDALSMLTAIWNSFPDDGKFACAGGNLGEDAVMDAPGKFEVSDTDGMTYTLLIPETLQPNIDDAASLMHMMNANIFTGAVVHMNNGDAASAADAIKEQVLNNQFMCGFPEKLAVLTAGDYVLYAFGAEMNIDNFVSGAKENISDVSEVYNDFF